MNWVDVINNPKNELSDDDVGYVNSKDISFIVDDNYDYYGNIDFDSLFEKQMLYYELTEGITIQKTSSDDISSFEIVSSSSTSSKTKSLSKNLIHSNINLYSDINKVDVFFVLIVDSDNEDIGFEIYEENDGDELIHRSTQDKNAKKYDFIPSRP